MARTRKQTTRAEFQAMKKKAKADKKRYLDEIAEKIDAERKKNNGKLPHGFTANFEKQFKTCCPSINRNSINHHYRVWSKNRASVTLVSNSQNDVAIDDATTAEVTRPITNHSDSDEKKKGGRPKGSTDQRKKELADAIVAAKNEITQKYYEAKTNCKKVLDGTLVKIIEDVKKKRKLPHDVQINSDTIRRRVSRGNIFITSHGPQSPLEALEEVVVELIIQMARIRQSLTPSKGLDLVNSLICGTEHQHALIEWKKKHTAHANVSGSVGIKYWRNFMKKHS